jgi:hypothetical protein
MSFYSKLDKTLAKLQRATKLGVAGRYYTDKKKTKYVEFECFKGDDAQTWGSGKPGRRKNADIVITATLAQWTDMPEKPTADPEVIATVIPEQGHTVEVAGVQYLIVAVSASLIAYTITCTDSNR